MVACNIIAFSFMLFCVSLKNVLHGLIYVGGSEQVGVTDYYKMYCMIVFHFEDSSSVIPFLFWCTVDKTKLKVFGPDWAIMMKLTNSFSIVL
jgi:hypothetical protein